MLDIGFMELLVIGVVALIVVGPRDLPGMFRTLGRFTAKARGMAREFQNAMNAAADESGMKETANSLKGMTSKKSLGLDALDRAADTFDKWQPGKTSTKPKPQTPAKPGPSAMPGSGQASETDTLRETQAARATERMKEAAERRAAREAPAPESKMEPVQRERPMRKKNMPVRKSGSRPVKRGR